LQIGLAIGISTNMRAMINDPAAKLRQMIENGDLERGSRLPPERVLCVEMGISRSTLRRALAKLEADKLIWRRVGQGTFVGPKEKSSELEGGQLVEMTSPAEIMEVRLVIEPKIAAMAATRATRQEMNKMRNAVLRSEHADSFAENEKWDLILHEIIARATNNHLLFTLFNTTNKLRRGRNWGRMKEASLTPERWKVYARQHHQLLAAIEDRDAVTAENAMRHHLEVVRDDLLNPG
jgi:GntR family uxuAB operon transcriptional repressor